MNFAFWWPFKDRYQQQMLYRASVQNLKIIHQILLMLCKINAVYERYIFIKLWKPFSPLFSFKNCDYIRKSIKHNFGYTCGRCIILSLNERLTPTLSSGIANSIFLFSDFSLILSWKPILLFWICMSNLYMCIGHGIERGSVIKGKVIML